MFVIMYIASVAKELGGLPATFVLTRALVSRREKDLGAEIAKMING